MDPRARRIVDLARHEDDPGAETAVRVRRSLAARIGTGAAVATAGAALSTATARAALLSVVGKATAVTVVALAGSGVGLLVVGSQRTEAEAGASSAASVVAASAVPVASSPVDRSPEPTNEPATVAGPGAPSNRERSPAATPDGDAPPVDRGPSAPRAREHEPTSEPGAPTRAAVALEVPTTPTTRASRAAPDQLRAEADSLRAVQRALAAGDPGLALQLVEAQDGRFADGQLGAERLAARVFALCDSGQIEAARAAASELQRRWPKSPVLARVLSSCVVQPSSNP